MSTIGPLLFYGGLILSIAGFVGDKAEHIPWAMKWLAGSYVRASRGLDALQTTGALSPGQVGFAELEELFQVQAESSGSGPRMFYPRVTKFERGTAMMALGEASAREVVPVEVVLPAQRVKWEMAALRIHADNLKHTILFRCSVFVFGAGLLITAAGRLLESQSSHERTEKAQEPTAPAPFE